MEFDLGLGDLEVIWRLGSFPSHLGSLKWGGDLLSPKIVCPLHGSLFPELMSASVTWNRPFMQLGGKNARMLAVSWVPSLSVQGLVLEILLRATFLKLFLSGRSGPPGPSSVIAFSQGWPWVWIGALMSQGPWRVGTGAFQLRRSRTLKQLWGPPDYV